MNEIPKDWRTDVFVGNRRIVLGATDIEEIRTAAIRYFEASNHPLRETFRFELQRLHAFVGQTGVAKIGFWAIENRCGKLELMRYPQPEALMTFYSVELSHDEYGWRGVSTKQNEFTSDDVEE